MNVEPPQDDDASRTALDRARHARALRAVEGCGVGALAGVCLWALGIGGIGAYTIAVAGVLGAMIALTRARRLLWGVAATAIVLLLIVAYTPLMRVLKGGLERRDALRPCPAVVVLGSYAFKDGTLGSAVQARALRGYEVLRQGY